MPRRRTVMLLLGAGAAAVAARRLARHSRGAARGHAADGGILIEDAGAYDRWTRRLLGGYFKTIAADVAGLVPDGGRVLEVGCGPGHLSIRLATEHGLDVTGLDLDPQMVERATANAAAEVEDEPKPAFVVGDVAALPFPDSSFAVVVSTLTMHHWDDPVAGLAEINRVLRPGGSALMWDLRPGAVPLHGKMPDPAEVVHDSVLKLVSVTPWRWPWRLQLSQRIELMKDAAATADKPKPKPKLKPATPAKPRRPRKKVEPTEAAGQ